MTLPAYIETHRVDPVRATFWLVEFDFTVPQRLTDCADDIVYGGNTYSTAALTVESVATDSSGVAATSASLSIGAGDDYWPALLAGLTEAERHPAVTIYEAWLDPTTLSPTPASVRTIGVFTLEAAKWTPREARITLAPSSDAAIARLPFREYGGGVCTYRKFKGAQCAYAGATTTCDRTYETCTSLGNQTRFGGLRAIAGETVTISWRWWQGDTLMTETVTLTRRSG